MPVRSPKWFILASLLVAAPDTPGVIELWDGDELVYVGAAHRSIRRKLARELLEQHAWSGRTTHFGWEISYHPSTRMRELLSEFEAEHHRAPRLNEA
jgi:hypothetical protein